MLDYWSGRLDLLSWLRSVEEEPIVQRLVKGHIDYFMDLKYFTTRSADDGEQHPLLGIGVELVLIGTTGQPVRPHSTAGARNGTHSNALAPRTLGGTGRFQCQPPEKLPDGCTVEMAASINIATH